MAVRKDDLYIAINKCLQPVRKELTIIDQRAKDILIQLDKIEARVKNLNTQLDKIEEAVKEKA